MSLRSFLSFLLISVVTSLHGTQGVKAQCITNDNMVATPPPTAGEYQAGQTVQFCYTINSYANLSTNWHLGVGFQLGAGWDASSITASGQPTSLDGNGTWLWTSNVTGSATGMNAPYWGWYYDSSSGGALDGNPGNNYGDCCGGPWTYCFTVTTSSCPPGSNGASLGITVHNYADGELGSWTSFDCGGDPNYVFNATLSCIQCGTASAVVDQNETCPGDADGQATASMTDGTAPFSYSWNTVPVQNTATATGLSAGNYTITVTDANNCVETASVTITSGIAEDGTIDPINPLCTSDVPVQLTTIQPGGTFSGTGVNGTGLFTPATAGPGTHIISYTTNGPCPDTQTLNITVVQDADATITDPFDPGNPTNTLCINDPAVQLNAVDPGGTWAGPGVGVGGLFDPLAAGVGVHNISYDIADPCGDSDVIVITITDATDATINNINPLNELCEDDPAVQLTTSDPGGTFSGTGVSGTGLFDPNIAGVGTHTITYSIAGNCPDVQTLDINVLPVADATINDVNIGNIVDINLPAFQLITVQPGGTFSGTGVTPTGVFDPMLAGPGIHTITYTIADPCGDTQTIDITVVNVTFTTTQVNVDCYGGTTGSITVSNETGTAPFQYSSDNGATFQSSNILSGLSVGFYTVIIVDDNGFPSAPQQVEITEPTELTILAQMDQQSDCGQATGEASALAQGGTVALNYSYSWNTVPPQMGPLASGLLPQQYTVTATDDNGCTASATVDITSTPTISVTIDNVVDPTCNGDCNGEATAVPGPNATVPVTYAWSDPGSQTTVTVTSLCSGAVSVTITDAVGCTATADTILYDPARIEVDISADTNQLCIGQSTGLYSTATGGTAPYTYAWTSAPSDPTLVSSTQNTSGTPVVTTEYSVVWTDALGCQSLPVPITINVHDPLTLFTSRPAPLGINDTAICPYDMATIDLTTTGGDGNYTYFLLPDQGTPVTLPMAVQPTSTTTYNFIVTDGCTTPEASISSIITVHALPVVDMITGPESGCQPWTVDFTDASSPTPATLVWNFGDPSSGSNYSSQPSTVHSFAQAGSYDITLSVTSPEGCINDSVFSDVVTVYPLPVADFTVTPDRINLLLAKIKFTDNSTDSIVDWSWDFGDGNLSDEQSPWHVYSDTGTFDVVLQVENEFGCVDNALHTVIIDPDFMFYVPNTFTPNGDGHNDYFMALGEGFFWDTFEMTIMNRWGNELFYTASQNNPWDGKYLGADVEVGVYVYRISFMDNLEEIREYMGRITVLR